MPMLTIFSRIFAVIVSISLSFPSFAEEVNIEFWVQKEHRKDYDKLILGKHSPNVSMKTYADGKENGHIATLTVETLGAPKTYEFTTILSTKSGKQLINTFTFSETTRTFPDPNMCQLSGKALQPQFTVTDEEAPCTSPPNTFEIYWTK
jgi:hypothetical protein